MNKPWDVIIELESDNSRLFKEAVVKREATAGNDEFFRGLRATLDSMITFGIKQVDEKTGDGRGLNPDTFWKTAEQLAKRQLTGDAARTAVNHMRLNATETEWNHWYRRILIKDLRCGVSEKTVNKMVAKINSKYEIPVFSCQLAVDSANNENEMTGKKIIEVKLDGMRVITIVYPDGKVDQYSRNGKELVNFPTVVAQIARHAKFFKEPMVLDGEIMSATFQDLMKQARRKENAQTQDAVLNLFDMITLDEFLAGRSNTAQVERSARLLGWYSLIAEHMPNVTVVGQEVVDLDTVEGQARFTEINAAAVAGGYEGIMIKDLDAGYECKRGRAWMKLKPFIEVSLTVVSVEEGTGKNVGRMGALLCEGTDAGKFIRVSVGGGYTDAQRDEFYTDDIIGSVIEVRADAATLNQGSTDVWSLRFPRFKTFRGFAKGEKL